MTTDVVSRPSDIMEIVDSQPVENVCHGCVSRAEVRGGTGYSHCRNGSGTRKGIVQRAVSNRLQNGLMAERSSQEKTV